MTLDLLDDALYRTWRAIRWIVTRTLYLTGRFTRRTIQRTRYSIAKKRLDLKAAWGRDPDLVIASIAACIATLFGTLTIVNLQGGTPFFIIFLAATNTIAWAYVASLKAQQV